MNISFKGGYCIKSLSEGVALTLRALLGYPSPRIENLYKTDDVYDLNIILNSF